MKKYAKTPSDRLRNAINSMVYKPLELSPDLVELHCAAIDSQVQFSRDDIMALTKGTSELIEIILCNPTHRLNHMNIISLSMALDIIASKHILVSINFPTVNHSLFNTMINILNRFASDSTMIHNAIENIMVRLKRMILSTTPHPNADPETMDYKELFDVKALGFAINKYNLPLMEKLVPKECWVKIVKPFNSEYDGYYDKVVVGPYRNVVSDVSFYKSLVALYCNNNTSIDLYVASGVFYEYIDSVLTATLNAGHQPDSIGRTWKVLGFLSKSEPYFVKKHPSISYLYDLLKLSNIELPKIEKRND